MQLIPGIQTNQSEIRLEHQGTQEAGTTDAKAATPYIEDDNLIVGMLSIKGKTIVTDI